MNQKVQNFTALALISLAIGSLGVVASTNPNFLFGAEAGVCNHNGNHYLELPATAEESGTQEHWICCKCHEVFLEKPNGSWKDNGQSKKVDESDKRYIPPYEEKPTDFAEYLRSIGFEKAKYLENGTISIGNYTGSSKTLIIPEGVTAITKTCFTSVSDMEWVVFPSTIKQWPSSAAGCFGKNNTNCLVYFVGTKRTVNKVAGVYGPEGTEWEYVNNVPTAL